MMKKFVSIFLMFSMLFALSAPAYATNDLPELGIGENEEIISDEIVYEGNEYTRVVTSFDPRTGINYSRVDSSNYFVVTAKDGDQITISTYQKSASRSVDGYKLLYTNSIDMAKNISTDTDMERVRQHYESSTFLIDDAYTYYTDINVWHLYCSDDWVTSGENASRRVLNGCEDFKENLLAMDQAGLELIEILFSADNSINVVVTLKNVVIAFSEDGFGHGVLELAKSSLLGLLGVYCPGVSYAAVAAAAARQGLVMEEYHDEYVTAFKLVKRLV